MRSIKKISEQVVAAEQLFGQFIEQHAKYSERLIHQIIAVEERIQAQQDEVERQRAEIASLNEENGQLCDVTWTLLQTIKAGNLDLVNEMTRDLGLKVSRLVEGDADEGKAPAVEAIAEVADAAEVVETKDSNIAAEAPETVEYPAPEIVEGPVASDSITEIDDREIAIEDPIRDDEARQCAPEVEISEAVKQAMEAWTDIEAKSAEASDESPGAGACAETDSPSSPSPAEDSVSVVMKRVRRVGQRDRGRAIAGR